jgi:SARP family transcriptional regulator, regulator of embCAB operon
MDIALFGPIRVEGAGAVLGPRDFGGRKPKQLLQLLALHPPGLSKERLAEQMWDGRPPANVAATVEHYACVLRRRLTALAVPGPSVVVSEPRGYRLDKRTVRLDLDRFDDLAARVSATGPADPVLWQTALALAAGDVCEDEPYAAWAVAARTRYRDRYVQLLLVAAQQTLLAGDAGQAVALAERAVTAEPLAERAYQSLVLGHYLLGDQSAALHAYHRCRRVLAAEMGIDPLPLTRTLFDGVLRQVPAGELLSRVAPPAMAAPAHGGR